jgi:hypothetical protein
MFMHAYAHRFSLPGFGLYPQQNVKTLAIAVLIDWTPVDKFLDRLRN